MEALRKYFAVYTAILGKKDLRRPLVVLRGCDFIFFTD
jgi:hypothetical protein